MSQVSKGKLFKAALQFEKPLQIVGVINAYCALLAKQAGFRALYLSGAGVSNAAFGLPDLAMTSLTEVSEETRRITGCVDLPLLVDADTGFGSTLNIQRAVRELIQAGAAGLHLEDQTWPKRCGHRAGKQLISKLAMVDRIKSAVDAKTDPDFIIMARTDAVEHEGIEASVARALSYVEAGADMIFAEAVLDIKQYQAFVKALSVPVLANITEFGQTPLFTVSELNAVGVALILYPLSAFRTMNRAAALAYRTIRKEGTQRSLIPHMQTRDELYQLLDYDNYESQLE